MKTRPSTPPMTLENMRANGVRSVLASCACVRDTSVNVDTLSDHASVPDIRFRLRCAKCGGRPSATRPDWTEETASGMGRQVPQ